MDTYEKEQQILLAKKLRKITQTFPEYAKDFFRAIAPVTQAKTKIAYAGDLKIFFDYLAKEKFHYDTISEISLCDLESLSPIDLEMFCEYLSCYTLPHYKDPSVLVTYTNTNRGIMRKLSSIRTFYKYFYKKELIKNNPALLVDLPKIHEKPIIRLEPNEVVTLLDDIQSGTHLTPSQQKYHSKTVKRDLAIVALLVGTGIRISECVGLDLDDFDFTDESFKITRKGGDQVILFMPQEVSVYIRDYLTSCRDRLLKSERCDDEPAFFLSLQGKRMSVSSIEKMLKKFTKISTPLKSISPHKLRSTFGTNLYRETGDIYLVADVLGHKDVNTTRKHYAAIEEDRRRIAAKVTKLKDDSHM